MQNYHLELDDQNSLHPPKSNGKPRAQSFATADLPFFNTSRAGPPPKYPRLALSSECCMQFGPFCEAGSVPDSRDLVAIFWGGKFQRILVLSSLSGNQKAQCHQSATDKSLAKTRKSQSHHSNIGKKFSVNFLQNYYLQGKQTSGSKQGKQPQI